MVERVQRRIVDRFARRHNADLAISPDFDRAHLKAGGESAFQRPCNVGLFEAGRHLKAGGESALQRPCNVVADGLAAAVVATPIFVLPLAVFDTALSAATQ